MYTHALNQCCSWGNDYKYPQGETVGRNFCMLFSYSIRMKVGHNHLSCGGTVISLICRHSKWNHLMLKPIFSLQTMLPPSAACNSCMASDLWYEHNVSNIRTYFTVTIHNKLIWLDDYLRLERCLAGIAMTHFSHKKITIQVITLCKEDRQWCLGS